eukprot:PhF_6_TR22325/c1_g1_i2/m.31605
MGCGSSNPCVSLTPVVASMQSISRTVSEYNSSSSPSPSLPIPNPFTPPQPLKCNTLKQAASSSSLSMSSLTAGATTKGYLIHGVVGAGQYGKVYLGEEKDKYFALKEIEVDKDLRSKEAEVLKRCVGHPCIVQYKGSFDSTDEDDDDRVNESKQQHKRMMCIVTEYVHGTSWGVSSLPQRKGPIPGTTESYNTLRGILRDVLSAVHYIHDVLHLAHMDIKPENIIVLSSAASNTSVLGSYAKLIDFGNAMDCDIGATTTRTAGTLYFNSPEKTRAMRLLGGTHTTSLGLEYCPQKADIWALGVTVTVAVYGHPDVPFPNVVSKSSLWKHLLPTSEDAKHITLPFTLTPGTETDHESHRVPGDLMDIMKWMLCWNPQQRPTARELLEHPYFQSTC